MPWTFDIIDLIRNKAHYKKIQEITGWKILKGPMHAIDKAMLVINDILKQKSKAKTYLYFICVLLIIFLV